MAGATVPEALCYAALFASQAAAAVVAAAGLRGIPDECRLGRGVGRLIQIDLMLTLLLPSRNSVWPRMLALTFERYIKYHRIMGRTTFVLMLIHAAQMYQFYEGDVFSARPSCIGVGMVWGPVSGALVLAMVVATLDPIRDRFYELFRYTHMMSMPALLFACLHATSTIYFIAPPLCLYLVDLVVRLTHRDQSARLVCARVYPGNVVELQMEAPGICERLRQRRGLGAFLYLHIAEVSQDPHDFHPFSVSRFFQLTLEEEEEERSRMVAVPGGAAALSQASLLSVHIQSRGPGTWTDRVCKLFQDGRGPDRVHVRLEGPYGEISLRWLAKYPTIMLIAGGIGITVLSPVLDLVADGRRRRNCLPHLSRLLLVWSVRRPDNIVWFRDVLEKLYSLVNSDGTARKRAAGLLVSLRLYVTREDIPSPSVATGLSDGSGALPPLIPGRPDLDGLMAGLGRESARKERAGRGVAVVACGPRPMSVEIGRLVNLHGFHWRQMNFYI